MRGCHAGGCPEHGPRYLFVLGASLAAVFKPGLTLSDKSALRSIIIKGRKSLLRVFYFDFFERPNLHVGLHLDREADLHGTPTQTEVSIKEMVHKRPKATAVHGNHKQIARDMLLHENAEQALKFVLRGGVDGLTPGASLTGLLQDQKLISLFQKRQILHDSDTPCPLLFHDERDEAASDFW